MIKYLTYNAKLLLQNLNLDTPLRIRCLHVLIYSIAPSFWIFISNWIALFFLPQFWEIYRHANGNGKWPNNAEIACVWSIEFLSGSIICKDFKPIFYRININSSQRPSIFYSTRTNYFRLYSIFKNQLEIYIRMLWETFLAVTFFRIRYDMLL